MTRELSTLVKETKGDLEEVRKRDEKLRRSYEQLKTAEDEKGSALRNYCIQVLNKVRRFKRLTKGRPKLKQKLKSILGANLRKSQKRDWIRLVIWKTSSESSKWKSKYYGIVKYIEAEKPKGTSLKEFWNKGDIKKRAADWARKQKRMTLQPKRRPG